MKARALNYASAQPKRLVAHIKKLLPYDLFAARHCAGRRFYKLCRAQQYAAPLCNTVILTSRRTVEQALPPLPPHYRILREAQRLSVLKSAMKRFLLQKIRSSCAKSAHVLDAHVAEDDFIRYYHISTWNIAARRARRHLLSFINRVGQRRKLCLRKRFAAHICGQSCRLQHRARLFARHGKGRAQVIEHCLAPHEECRRHGAY